MNAVREILPDKINEPLVNILIQVTWNASVPVEECFALERHQYMQSHHDFRLHSSKVALPFHETGEFHNFGYKEKSLAANGQSWALDEDDLTYFYQFFI